MNKDEFQFKATGKILINGVWEPFHDSSGNIIGFKTHKGIVRLCIALELEKPNGEYEYLSTEQPMQSIGATIVEYDELDFFPVDE